MSYSGTERVDLHGKNIFQSKTILNSVIRKARSGVYRICVIHGFNNGTILRDMILEEYTNHPKVLRVESSGNSGETILVLKDLY